MSKSHPQSTLLLQESKPLQAQPGLHSCTQHPWASSWIQPAPTVCQSAKRPGPGSDATHSPAMTIYALMGGMGPPKRCPGSTCLCSCPFSTHTTLYPDLTRMGQRRWNKTHPGSEGKPSPSLQRNCISVYQDGIFLRLWGYFLHPLNIFSTEGLIAVGGGGRRRVQHEASRRRAPVLLRGAQPASDVQLHTKKRKNRTPACSTPPASLLAQRALPWRH